MSDDGLQPEEPRDDTGRAAPADADLDETPAAAGGHDDGEPEQGEGSANSY